MSFTIGLPSGSGSGPFTGGWVRGWCACVAFGVDAWLLLPEAVGPLPALAGANSVPTATPPPSSTTAETAATTLVSTGRRRPAGRRRDGSPPRCLDECRAADLGPGRSDG